LGGKTMARSKVLGIPLGAREIQIGPVKNSQFLYILLDRSLIYFSHVSNWAHGRRDIEAGRIEQGQEPARSGYAARWDAGVRSTCNTFFKELTRSNGSSNPDTEQQMKIFLTAQLQKLSNSEHLKII